MYDYMKALQRQFETKPRSIQELADEVDRTHRELSSRLAKEDRKLLLHQALDVAVNRHLIVKNPSNDVTLPKKVTTAKTILNDEQLERFAENAGRNERDAVSIWQKAY